jgi:hypothetical protein
MLQRQVEAAAERTALYVEYFGPDFNDRLDELPEFCGSWEVRKQIWDDNPFAVKVG